MLQKSSVANDFLLKIQRRIYSMSRLKSDNELFAHKAHAIQKLDNYLDSLISSEDAKKKGKSDKLCYWLEDWATFLDFEAQFSPQSLRRYKRGEIIKVHLGFNVGSEEGGLHYAVVLDKNNAKSSPVISIVPLSSVKPHTEITKLKNGSLFLGNELFTNLNAKVSTTNKRLVEELNILEQLVNQMDSNSPLEERRVISERIKVCQAELTFLNRMREEVLKMRRGSIALVNQITTISKIRIYDPKTDHDILSGIKLSNEKLDMIDAELIKNFTNS